MRILDTGSKATRSSARFGLFDLEDKMSSGLNMVKKENFASSLPSKKAHIDLNVMTLGSQKWKTVEALDLRLENHESEEALRKLISFSQAVIISLAMILVFLILYILISFSS